jgi:integrase
MLGRLSKESVMRQSDLFNTPRRPWNAGRLIGPKAPLKPKHIWAIRQQLKTLQRVRDLAMFNCALDAKLRACDLVKLTVSDVAPGGGLRERSTVIQQKTGRPVPFEITEPTRDALRVWLFAVVAGATTGCSQAAAGRAATWALANTLVSSTPGFR